MNTALLKFLANLPSLPQASICLPHLCTASHPEPSSAERWFFNSHVFLGMLWMGKVLCSPAAVLPEAGAPGGCRLLFSDWVANVCTYLKNLRVNKGFSSDFQGDLLDILERPGSLCVKPCSPRCTLVTQHFPICPHPLLHKLEGPAPRGPPSQRLCCCTDCLHTPAPPWSVGLGGPGNYSSSKSPGDAEAAVGDSTQTPEPRGLKPTVGSA